MSWNLNTLQRNIGAGVCLAFALSLPVCAEMKFFANTFQTIDGVSTLGLPSTKNGAKGPGKVYKDLSTGVVMQTGSALVKNEFLFGKVFKNRGLTIFDPVSYKKLTSTSDITIYTKRTANIQGVKNDTGWTATETKIFTP